MLDTDPRKLHFFFGTAPQPCPYIIGQMESKAVTELGGLQASELHDHLSQAGFRRSHGIAYRPACRGCQACVPVRVRTFDFVLTKSFKRILRKCQHLRWQRRPAVATHEQFALFHDYEQARHHDGEMASMDFEDYRSMVEDTPIETSVYEFRSPDGVLVAASLTDSLSDGLSGVYKFFDPDITATSLGTFVILWHVHQARSLGLPYVYLGYWIAQSRKMAYKARFRPLEGLIGPGWQVMDTITAGLDHPPHSTEGTTR